MAIHINPSTVGSSSGNIRRPGVRDRRAADHAPAEKESLEAYAPPAARAHVNFIPSVESLATLIQGAVAALRRGVYWDRGTILNLLV